ncbi:Uncharacterised protein [Mycobacteroides abscessus subsp. abscessus]|nr:Uncharacterised protein [Mycobacteroides abscessus subsp. abscessus]SIG98218.1 Uncharacterised protein [Mycobacteroides abscessus subsp. abscessus]
MRRKELDYGSIECVIIRQLVTTMHYEARVSVYLYGVGDKPRQSINLEGLSMRGSL